MAKAKFRNPKDNGTLACRNARSVAVGLFDSKLVLTATIDNGAVANFVPLWNPCQKRSQRFAVHLANLVNAGGAGAAPTTFTLALHRFSAAATIEQVSFTIIEKAAYGPPTLDYPANGDTISGDGFYAYGGESDPISQASMTCNATNATIEADYIYEEGSFWCAFFPTLSTPGAYTLRVLDVGSVAATGTPCNVNIT